MEKETSGATEGKKRPEKRSAKREQVDQYHSVEFLVQGLERIYQFKIWNLSSSGMCILVKDDSKVLEHIAVGDVIKMKYYHSEHPGSAEHYETKVKHITKEVSGRFKGHHLIGLLISINK